MPCGNCGGKGVAVACVRCEDCGVVYEAPTIEQAKADWRLANDN